MFEVYCDNMWNLTKYKNVSLLHLKEKADISGLFVFFHFQSVEQVLETKLPNGVNPNPDSPAHPDTHLDLHRKVAITPLDMNRFQSKAFHAVISQHCKQGSVSSAVGQPLKREPSLHLDTPSKFLSKDKLFKPSFDVTVRLQGNDANAKRSYSL